MYWVLDENQQQLLLRLLPENIACRIELTAEPAFVLHAWDGQRLVSHLVHVDRDGTAG